MSYFAALLILVSAAVAQSPRELTNQPITRQIEYHAISVSSRGEVSSATCAEFKQPEAKDTPNPIINAGSGAVIDLVVAWDGNIYSPLVEEDDGVNVKAVLRTVKSWRFRPALCNGSPIAAEVRIKFQR